jgi:pSer/pThr/pTyr-binding forkhead associated (FHA) protein
MTDVPPSETRAATPAEVRAVIDAEMSGLPFLQWRTGEGKQMLTLLGDDRSRITVGRKTESDIALTWDAEVSRTHALFEHIGGRWVVVDDGISTNGSFVNGGRVSGRHTLHDRDRICFGQTILVFREPEEGETESTARASLSHTSVPISETQRKVLIALCRPLSESRTAVPATNKQIADELFLSVDAVKAHLRALFERFGLEELPQNEKRMRLASTVLGEGILKPHDF